MESTEQERRHFAEVAAILEYSEEEITSPSILSLETIHEVWQLLLSVRFYLSRNSNLLVFCSVLQTEEEVERLTKLKATRMKELVLKRRLELENICRNAHMEPDVSTAPEKIIALIDSGIYPAVMLILHI